MPLQVYLVNKTLYICFLKTNSNIDIKSLCRDFEYQEVLKNISYNFSGSTFESPIPMHDSHFKI